MAGKRGAFMNIIEIDHLTKRFGGINAVEDISFFVKQGEIFGVIGPNGAGKTTLFNLITGFYRPDRGIIRFKGRDITKISPYLLPHMGLVRTFQNLRLFSNLTVYENLISAALMRKRYGLFSAIFRAGHYHHAEAEAERMAMDFLRDFQLIGREDQPASSLPYGEQRRLEMARALLTGPELMLIDEPGAGMNPKEIGTLAMTIKEVKERFGLTIVMIEHHMDLIMGVSDRIMVMDFGKKIMEGNPAEVKKDKGVIEAYLGESL